VASTNLNEFWTQAEYRIHFRIENERLSVSISDGLYAKRISPSSRSDGFQWYLSFYATLLTDVDSSKPTVILLDNPGLELHLDGQRDIKALLEQKFSRNAQVIYVTHSPAMIDPFQLSQVRSVELFGNDQGTKIKRYVPSTDGTDLLEPIRAAIGMSLVSSLVLNKMNILVEGAADKPVVEGIFFKHYVEKAEGILVNGPIAEDIFLAQFYSKTGLPYAVLLDNDSGGRDLHRELTSAGIAEGKILQLQTVFTHITKDFAMEDILSEDFYLTCVQDAYPHLTIEKPTNIGQRKISRVYEDYFQATFRFGFNKRRVAESAKKLLKEAKEDKVTQDNLGLLSTALLGILEKKEEKSAAASAPERSPKGK
jgi:hypothetical protein